MISHHIIITWFIGTNCLSLIRWYLFHQFNKLDREAPVADIWYNLVVITSALSGAIWGVAGIWLFSETDIVHQVFLVFVIAGMCAGGITTLSAILNAAWAFVVLSISTDRNSVCPGQHPNQYCHDNYVPVVYGDDVGILQAPE